MQKVHRVQRVQKVQKVQRVMVGGCAANLYKTFTTALAGERKSHRRWLITKMGILLMIPRVSKEHQKGCISHGRSPVCLFFTPVRRLLGFPFREAKLYTHRREAAIPHPLNPLNLLNPLNPATQWLQWRYLSPLNPLNPLNLTGQPYSSWSGIRICGIIMMYLQALPCAFISQGADAAPLGIRGRSVELV